VPRSDARGVWRVTLSTWVRRVQVVNSGIYNYTYRQRNGGSGEASITIRNHPLPFNRYESIFLGSLSTFLVAIAVVIGFAFVSAFYAAFLVNERENSSKHQQVRPVGFPVLTDWDARGARCSVASHVPVMHAPRAESSAEARECTTC
jgi:hypothetical protein